jgi:hypothetical protein
MHSRQWVLRSSLMVLLALVVQPVTSHGAVAERSYAGGHVAVDINGERQPVVSVEGGSAVGVVAANRSESGIDKQISGVKYEDIVLSLSATDLPKAITDALRGKGSPLKGGIEYFDFNYKGERRVSFNDAIVSAIRFPALDGASKDAARVEVVLSPTTTREEPAPADLKSGFTAKQKSAITSAFRVTIPDVLTTRVSAIAPIEVRSKSGSGNGGATKGESGYEIPNIKLTVSAADLKSWQQWLDKTLADGGSKNEKTMRVELLDGTLKNPLLTLELSGVGIVAVRMKSQANSEQAARFDVELYAEQLKVTGGEGGTKAAAAEAAPAPPAANAPTPAADSAKSDATVSKEPVATPTAKPLRRAR